MRIALDTQSTVGRKTGIGIYTARLLDALRRVGPEHEYREIAWGRDVSMRLDRRLRWQQWELPRRARAAGADLLHVPGFDAPRRKPCPVVLAVHDLIGMLFPQNLAKFEHLLIPGKLVQVRMNKMPDGESYSASNVIDLEEAFQKQVQQCSS